MGGPAGLSGTRSPLSLVGNVQTPTLVVVGSEDYRTPVSEAEQYYTALQLRGVPTALVKVPGASHGGIASRPSQSGAKAGAILAWFQRYREGAPAEGGWKCRTVKFETLGRYHDHWAWLVLSAPDRFRDVRTFSLLDDQQTALRDADPR